MRGRKHVPKAPKPALANPNRTRLHVECAACGRVLSRELTLESRNPNEGDGQPFVQPGSWIVSDGEFFTSTRGKLVINLGDALNMGRHPHRLSGCCGPSGMDGPNRVCGCGKEVGTEKSDCWMPHALIFEPGAVRVVDLKSQ